jgi:hypothetical protein
MIRYPKIVAAAKAGQDAHWALAFALLEEVGPPPAQGERDGSYDKMIEAAEDILDFANVQYEIKTLAQLRRLALTFKSVLNLPVIGVAIVAQTPDILAHIREIAGPRPLTVELAREIKWKLDGYPDKKKHKREQERKKPIRSTSQFAKYVKKYAIEVVEGAADLNDMLDQLADKETDLTEWQYVSALREMKAASTAANTLYSRLLQQAPSEAVNEFKEAEARKAQEREEAFGGPDDIEGFSDVTP